MITEFVRALREAGLDPSPVEVADALWLAAHMDRDLDPPHVATMEVPNVRTHSDASTGGSQAQTADKVEKEHDDAAELHPLASDGGPTRRGYAGTSFLTPSAPALTNALALARSLRPLKRKVRSKREQEIDEEATIQQAAEGGPQVPVLRPTHERWLEVALVVEKCESTALWRTTIEEFRRLVERVGAFRDVRLWTLRSEPGVGLVVAPDGALGQARDPRELVNTSGRRLILVISDFTSNLWFTDEVQQVLSAWSVSSPTALLSLLPERLFPQTAIGPLTGRARAPAPGSPSGSLKRTKHGRFPRRRTDVRLMLPVAAIEPRALASWSAMVAGTGGDVPAVFLATAGAVREPRDIDGAEHDNRNTDGRTAVELFRATASPLARELASYLAAAPLTLRVMRLVQSALLPQSSHVHLAEVFLSGLLRRARDAEDPEDVLYEFVGDAREWLLNDLAVSDTLQVLEGVSEFISVQLDTPNRFISVLRDPDGEGDFELGDAEHPFAFVAARVLRRLGGRYARIATRLNSAVTPSGSRIAKQLGDPQLPLESEVADSTNMEAGIAAILEMISAERGVPIEPLRAILELLGEEGVPHEQIPARLAAKANELLALREQWSRVAEASPSIVAVERDAQALIDAGDLPGARKLLADARSAIRIERAKRAPEVVRLLTAEAEVNRLQFRYREAAECYAEAMAWVADFDQDARFEYLCKQASSLQQQGDEFGDNTALAEAAELWLWAADMRPRAERPLERAMALNNLGNALRILGERESGTERLEESVQAYRAALEERTREQVPLDWAMTLNNLGHALFALGRRERGTERVEEAVQAFQAALEEQTLERVPLARAMTLNNLGSALAHLGEREHGTKRLEEAVQAYRAALDVQTREREPLGWAMTLNNLGNALRILGERESGTERLEEAVQAYRAALEERTRERVPLAWAMTLNNLGNVLQALGEREHSTERLEAAVQVYRAALEEQTRERVPLDWAMTQNNIGNALQVLGRRERDTERLEEAVKAYRAALEEQTRERVPLTWAKTQSSLASALYVLGVREHGTERLEEAVQAYRAALEERTHERVPLEWANTQRNLGKALHALGERGSGTERLEEALEAYHAALKGFAAIGVIHHAAQMREEFDHTRALLKKRSRRAK